MNGFRVWVDDWGPDDAGEVFMPGVDLSERTNLGEKRDVNWVLSLLLIGVTFSMSSSWDCRRGPTRVAELSDRDHGTGVKHDADSD